MPALLAGSMIASGQTKLIYVGDPMCSWCYGISEELAKIWDQYDGLEKEIVLGGLRPGGGDLWTAEFKSFLRHHWEEIHERSGVEFRFDVLDREVFEYDTQPACQAVLLLAQQRPTAALDIFAAVQRGFYYDNKDPKVKTFYRDICRQLDLDYEVFAQQFGTNNADSATANQFNRARALGVNSFPSILLEHKGQVHRIASGYVTADKMKASIDTVLNP